MTVVTRKHLSIVIVRSIDKPRITVQVVFKKALDSKLRNILWDLLNEFCFFCIVVALR